MTSIKKIFGPPGTGKTTTLLNKVEEYLKKGNKINNLGYFAFTKKAAKHAKETLLSRDLGLKEKELKNFQTLHSFAFHSLGLSEELIMQPEHYEIIGKELGIRIKEDSDGNCYLKFNNEYFNLINSARVKDISVEEEFHSNNWSRDIDLTTLKSINQTIENYKKAYNLKDYNDMINDFIKKKDDCRNFDIIFIDEAQDLSPIQWKMFDVLKERCNEIYLAGDDDQAIFAWAGADVDRFINQPGEHIILDQSRRIPVAVQECAENILENISTRVNKKYTPTTDQGSVEKIRSLDYVDLDSGNWLILTRVLYRSDEIAHFLKTRGVYFKTRYGKSFNSKLYKAVLNYMLLQKGEKITSADAKDIVGFIKDDLQVKDGEVSAADLDIDFQQQWFEVFDNAKNIDIEYIRRLREKGFNLGEEPKVEVSTIHAAKGGECDNVILVLDNTKKIRKNIKFSQEKEDEEHRVWYVGTTRTKENLYFLQAKKEINGYRI